MAARGTRNNSGQNFGNGNGGNNQPYNRQQYQYGEVAPGQFASGMADQNGAQQQPGGNIAGGRGGNFNSSFPPRMGFGGNSGDGRVAQGYQNQNQRGGFQQQFFQGEGSGNSSNNSGQNFDNQQQFNGPVFGGDFGSFDEGFYDNGNVQNLNQNQGFFSSGDHTSNRTIILGVVSLAITMVAGISMVEFQGRMWSSKMHHRMVCQIQWFLVWRSTRRL
jgi:hypothetical protein